MEGGGGSSETYYEALKDEVQCTFPFSREKKGGDDLTF